MANHRGALCRLRLPTDRIAHFDLAGDCYAAGFRLSVGPLWVILDGLIEDRRQVDVRSCPENAEPGPSQKLLAMGQTPVIQAPRLGARIMRYELADYEWTAIRPMLPNKPRGVLG